MFLMHNQELSVWRKQATISVQDEFVGRALPPDLEDSLPPTLDETFDTVRSGVKRSAEVYINLCTLLERLAKRNDGLAADHLRFSLALQSLTEVTKDTYSVETNDIPSLNMGITATARHLSVSQSLLEDEARAWSAGVLEDLKRQRDCLVSVREMFDRRDRYARNNIPQLERRIETNERKLQELRSRPAGTVKPGEIEKVEDAIFKVCDLTPPASSVRRLGSTNISGCAGQGVDRGTACPWSIYQGVYSRRASSLPTKPVSHQSAAPRLEPGAGEIFRAAGGELASSE
jgi:sorting nexin-8